MRTVEIFERPFLTEEPTKIEGLGTRQKQVNASGWKGELGGYVLVMEPE